MNHAYAMLLSSQFQGFCRDLHSEAVDFLTSTPALLLLGPLVRKALIQGRKLDQGNPNPSNLGSDFARLGINFWPTVNALDAKNKDRQEALEELTKWRNAIAHQDWMSAPGQSPRLHLKQVQVWRSICSTLAASFDRAVGDHLKELVGSPPW